MVISKLNIPNINERIFAIIQTSEFCLNGETSISVCTSLKDLYNFGFDVNEVNSVINSLNVNDMYVSNYYGKNVIVIRTA